jgi:hypothetical protein
MINGWNTWEHVRTRVIAVNGGLHERFHPFTDDRLFIGAEHMRFLRLVYKFEPVLPRIDLLVRNNAIAGRINVAFDPNLL